MKKRLFIILALALLLIPIIPPVFASPGIVYEDFNDFSETDPKGQIDVVNATHVDFTCDRDAVAYLVKDYGAGYFQDYLMWVNILLSEAASNGDYWLHLGFKDWLGNSRQAEVAGKPHYFLYVISNGAGTYTFGIKEFDGAAWRYSNTTINISLDTVYYIEATKDGAYWLIELYSTDALRLAGESADVGAIDITFQSDYHFRYSFICDTWNDGSALTATGWVEYFTIRPSQPENMSLTITNMDDTNYLYTEKRFYNFTMIAYSRKNNLKEAHFRFSDGLNTIQVKYTVSTGVALFISGDTYAELDSAFDSGYSNHNITVYIGLWLESDIDREQNVDFEMYTKCDYDWTAGWQTMQTDYAHISVEEVVGYNPIGAAFLILLIGSFLAVGMIMMLRRRRR